MRDRNEACLTCGHPSHWHRHDDVGCPTKHAQPCHPSTAQFRCLGYDCERPGAVVVIVVLIVVGAMLRTPPDQIAETRRAETIAPALPIYEVGATYQRSAPDGDAWRTMDTAPRDGTIVEIKCTYGVAPWYGLYFWSDEIVWPDGRKSKTEPHWRDANDSRRGVSGEDTLLWRQYRGDPKSYIDPTNGAQSESAYWRGAVAAKHGLRSDYFEKEAERNRKRSRSK